MAYIDDIGSAPGQAYDWAKRQFISLTKPNEDDGDYTTRSAAIARQQKLAEALSQMGNQEQAVYTAGGITAPMSPMGALARGLSSFGGSYLAGKAAGDEAAAKKAAKTEAVTALESLYKLPDTTGLVMSAADTGETKMPITAPAFTIPGSNIPNAAVTGYGMMPNAPRTEVGTIPGADRPYAEQQKMLNQWALSDNPNLAALAPVLAAQLKPEYKEVGAGGLARINPNGTVSSVVGPKPTKEFRQLTPQEVAQSGLPKGTLAVIGSDGNLEVKYNPTANAISESMLGIAQANLALNQKRQNGQFGLNDQENDALFGPNGAVARGLVNPDRINSRTAHILAKAAMANPDLNMVNAAGVAAMMKNPTFQNKAMVADTLPAIIENVKEAGQKVDFSNVAFVGKLQAFTKGQLNDPDFISYMAQRNDAIQAITNVMRGVGMSDKSIELELKAAPETMSPKAFEAWAQSQNAMLAPRLHKYQGIILNTNAPGGQNTAMPQNNKPVSGTPEYVRGADGKLKLKGT